MMIMVVFYSVYFLVNIAKAFVLISNVMKLAICCNTVGCFSNG